MKILGIVGSRRKLGNTEILIKEALKGAREEGASAAILRLSDLNIQECNGCMACFIRKEHCRLQDDMDFVGQQLDAADGLVVGGPSYGGRPPGMFKTIQDRFRGLVREPIPGRKAVTIATAGLRKRAQWVVPLLNSFVRSADYQVIGSFLACSEGPGEVLLLERKEILPQINALGRTLVYALNGEEDKVPPLQLRGYDQVAGEPGQDITIEYPGDRLFTEKLCCPFCFSQAFELMSPTELECAFCHNSRAHYTVDNGQVMFHLKAKPSEELHIRDRYGMDRIVASGPRFQARRKEINALRAGYADIGVSWEAPLGRVANLPSLAATAPGR